MCLEITLSPYMPKYGKIAECGSVEKSHGCIEIRKIRTAELSKTYLGWPGVCQVIEIERTRECHNKMTKEVVYGITSFSPNRASAENLLFYVRRHWGIENQLHHVRDVTFNEDRCRVRHHGKAQILAAIRSVVITLLRHAGFENIMEGREWCSDAHIRPIHLLFGRTE
jgi:predicted transposase YbfD/YdcC